MKINFRRSLGILRIPFSGVCVFLHMFGSFRAFSAGVEGYGGRHFADFLFDIQIGNDNDFLTIRKHLTNTCITDACRSRIGCTTRQSTLENSCRRLSAWALIITCARWP